MTMKAMSLVLVSILASGQALADDSGHRGGHAGNMGEMRKVMSDCAKAAGVELPKNGQMQGQMHAMMSSITDEQRAKLHACMSEKGMGHGGQHNGNGHRHEKPKST